MVYFRVSERQIYVFKADNLNNPLTTVGLDVSPAILMPYYDEDSSTLFLTGRVSFLYILAMTDIRKISKYNKNKLFVNNMFLG